MPNPLTVVNEQKLVAKVLQRVGCLEGIVSDHVEDEIAIQAGHMDDYLFVTYLEQLLERGEMEIRIVPERMEYFKKLLHLDSRRQGYKDDTCKYLQAEDVSDNEALGHSNTPCYKYYCTKKNKEILFPFICQKKCKEYKEQEDR